MIIHFLCVYVLFDFTQTSDSSTDIVERTAFVMCFNKNRLLLYKVVHLMV